MLKTDLATYDNHPYHPGGNAFKRLLWYYCNICFFKSGCIPGSGFKIALLRLFGAKVGTGVTIKPGVNIKYPWFLTISNHTWIGENAWIDCLTNVSIGSNVCISQGAVILTGNHNYKTTSFNLIVQPVILEDGVWIGAGAWVNAGVTAASHSVLTTGSVANKYLEPYGIYQGNPAVKIRERHISSNLTTTLPA